jgi:hypothetical protein
MSPACSKLLRAKQRQSLRSNAPNKDRMRSSEALQLSRATDTGIPQQMRNLSPACVSKAYRPVEGEHDCFFSRHAAFLSIILLR